MIPEILSVPVAVARHEARCPAVVRKPQGELWIHYLIFNMK